MPTRAQVLDLVPTLSLLMMNDILTFVVSTDGACINEALTSLDV